MGGIPTSTSQRRRSLIVTSTPSLLDLPRGQSPKSTNDTPSSSPQDVLTSAATSSSSMYGPTVVSYPPQSWNQYPQQYASQQLPPIYPSQPGQVPVEHQTLSTSQYQPSFPSQQHFRQDHMGDTPIATGTQSYPYSNSAQTQPPYNMFHGQGLPTATASGQGPYYSHGPMPQQTYFDPYSSSYPPPASHMYSLANYPAYTHHSQVAGPQMQQYPYWPQPSYGPPMFYQPQQGYVNEQNLFVPQFSLNPTSPGRRSSIPPNRSPGFGNENFRPYSPATIDPSHLGVGPRGGFSRHHIQQGQRSRRMSPTSSINTTGRSSTASGSAVASGNTLRSSMSTVGTSPGSEHPSIPRGPPRKPKQSGHALWVGNLPPDTTVLALKDYFATQEIESVFLISKSNCAFVNYKTEAACSEAMNRFHDSRFQGVRLVCRLRRSSSPTTAVPTQATPVALTNEVESTIKEEVGDDSDILQSVSPETEIQQPLPQTVSRGGKERFFIVKSLTVEDLDLSARNGIWATQSHNEAALDLAFNSAESVYLIFSANKSGEYYGYAKMASGISDEVSSKIEWAPAAQVLDDPDLPKAIYTPSTETSPRGRVIDDSARGTIFWEAVDDENIEDDDQNSDMTSGEDDKITISKSWGKPFRVEWISTVKVPFYRVRGLRNPYNVSREVKIARDGTELEPTVGTRLLQMFQRGSLTPSDPIQEISTFSSEIPASMAETTPVSSSAHALVSEAQFSDDFAVLDMEEEPATVPGDA